MSSSSGRRRLLFIMDLYFQRARFACESQPIVEGAMGDIRRFIEFKSAEAADKLERYLRDLKDDVIDAVIATATGGPFCHTEVGIGNGRAFSADFDGVRFREIGHDWRPPGWECIEIPGRASSEALVWAYSICGAPYDYLGAVCSGLRLSIKDPRKRFCSDVAAEFLSRSGVTDAPTAPTPNELYQWAMQRSAS